MRVTPVENRLSLTVVAVALFVVAMAYLSFTAQQLPLSAGPDASLTRAAIDFYVEHKRLAKMPDDEALATFSPFGDARILRPPLPYLVSAQLLELSPFTGDEYQKLRYRHGSSVFLALSISLIFVSCCLVLRHRLMALVISLCLLLMPQLTFLGSYANDDTAAIFAVTSLTTCMLVLAQHGINYWRLAWFGLSLGLILIAKATAWLILPSALIFYLLKIAAPALRRDFSLLLKQGFCIGIWLMIGGGWWILWNISNYGWDDPLARGLIAELAEKHRRREVDGLGFYAIHGVNVTGLLLMDFKGFWLATYKAVVGHIDWLALPMSATQYGFYAVFLVSFLFSLPLLLIQTLRTGFSALSENRIRRPFPWLLCLMLLTLAIQFLVFAYHNVYNDIQLQGKYLLPAILPFLLVALVLPSVLIARLERSGWVSLISCLLLLLAVMVHYHGITQVVMPFYDGRLG